MISIIISSANTEQLKQVTENIAATIGIPFEIIAIDNSKGQQGICAVYNKGIAKAKYGILCFMHEDVFIKTSNWGNILKNIFDKNSDVGLLGVCGGSYKPYTPSSWGGLGLSNAYFNFIQTYKYKVREPEFHYRNPDGVMLAPVACVDGVWLVTTSKVAAKYKFDEDNFKGFHVYDLDYSIAVGQEYKVCVTYEVLLNHLSEGKFNAEWVEDTLKLHEKWKEILPVNIAGYTFEQRRHVEKVSFRHFVMNLAKLKLPMRTAFNYLWNNKIYRELGLFWKLQFDIFKIYAEQG